MANQTVIQGLQLYAIGEKLRTLRLKKSMGLVELGRHTKLSPAMLSKLERNKLYPTLPTLLRIAMVFGVGLDFFFRDDRKRHVAVVSRKKERMRFPESPSGNLSAYTFESLDYKATEKKMNSFFAEFEPLAGSKARAHAHPGVEMVYIVTGKLLLTIGTDEHVLEAGDAIYFDAAIRHSYARAGARKCTGVVVTA